MRTKNDLLTTIVSDVKRANASLELALTLYMNMLDVLDWIDSDVLEEVELEHKVFMEKWGEQND